MTDMQKVRRAILQRAAADGAELFGAPNAEPSITRWNNINIDGLAADIISALAEAPAQVARSARTEPSERAEEVRDQLRSSVYGGRFTVGSVRDPRPSDPENPLAELWDRVAELEERVEALEPADPVAVVDAAFWEGVTRARLNDRVEELERWRASFKSEMVAPPAPQPPVTCAQCFGRGQVPGAAIGGFVSCPGCKGAGVHRV